MKAAVNVGWDVGVVGLSPALPLGRARAQKLWYMDLFALRPAESSCTRNQTLHWQVDSYSLHHQESPALMIFKCTVQWYSAYSDCFATLTTTVSRTLFILQN